MYNQAKLRQMGREFGTRKRLRSIFFEADRGAGSFRAPARPPVSGQGIAFRADAGLIARKLPLGL
jgi:hypothetical protein